ncbi:transcription termination factor NusA [Candidatus Dependentiae bacterium]|nr:transcription termination factor NusA [Candidatus Dependentiae bacterium]MBU4386864.1 transcription termination factor NusA [Candidatus Dependentiae bacterium]MCG2756473.1 transcription termination factor NusA [Candidatus Dependentiae bacterium]
MNLIDVIEGLVDERGLDKESVISAVCEGVLAAFQKKFPETPLKVVFNKKIGELEAFVDKTVVATAKDSDTEISLRRAKVIDAKAKVGDIIAVPFEHKIGRIEILTAKQIIANKIKALEQSSVYNDFKDKQGSIISGTVYKRERAGFAVKIGEITALLPNENLIPMENLRAGLPIRALLKEVLPVSMGDYQLILDRGSAAFVKKLLEIEIPEVFEGVVEVKKIVRIPGYKTKAVVLSNNKDIDPVGTCVGVGGSRIKPILRELGQEKIDLIQTTDSLESLIKLSLKPAEIDKVAIEGDGKAMVWLAQDQRSLAIGKMGQNINLASRLVGLEIQLQDVGGEDSSKK